MNSIVKIIIIATLILCSGIFWTKPASATWGEPMMAEEMGQMMDAIEKQIYGVIMGAMKQAAVKAIEGQISNITSGGGSGSEGAMFITKWDDFLYKEPAKQTELFMNDFFSQTSRGASSSTNYLSAFSSGSGSGSGYAGQLVEQAKSAIEGGLPQTNFQEYASDPSQMFAKGNWRAWNAFISNPANNPFGYTLMAQQAYMSEMDRRINEAMTKATAYQGYLGQMQGGEVVTPGSIIKDIQSKAEGMSFDVLSNARDIPEVITALVTRIVTKTITQGIGKAAQNAQRNDSSTGTSSSSSSNPSFGIFGSFGR